MVRVVTQRWMEEHSTPRTVMARSRASRTTGCGAAVQPEVSRSRRRWRREAMRT
jgi:hypothetical protein